jgi:hypothetical protein
MDYYQIIGPEIPIGDVPILVEIAQAPNRYLGTGSPLRLGTRINAHF